MTYSTLQTIAIVCYMISAGLLIVSILIFFLMDMRQIIGRLTGSSQRKALARMRGGAVGKTGETVIDMSVLEKTGRPTVQRRDRSDHISGQQPKSPPAQPAPSAEPAQPQGGTPDYFGAAYPNKTPPSPPPAPPAAQTVVIQQPEPQKAPAPGGETIDLEQWQESKHQDMQAVDDAVEPVKMTILDEIVLLHTEKFIEF